MLLVTSVELLHEWFLGLLYEATCHAHITHLYPPEERMRIINTIRSSSPSSKFILILLVHLFIKTNL